MLIMIRINMTLMKTKGFMKDHQSNGLKTAFICCFKCTIVKYSCFVHGSLNAFQLNYNYSVLL